MRTPEPIDSCSKEMLRLHLKALDVGLWDYDIDADDLVCDARWYQMLMLVPVPGSIRNMAAFMPHIHPDDRDHATAIDPDGVTKMIQADERYHVDFRVIRSDGAVLCWRSVACVVRDPKTGRRRAIGCVSDIAAESAVAGSAPPPQRNGPAEAGRDSFASPACLTSREVECLRWVSLGKTA